MKMRIYQGQTNPFSQPVGSYHSYPKNSSRQILLQTQFAGKFCQPHLLNIYQFILIQYFDSSMIFFSNFSFPLDFSVNKYLCILFTLHNHYIPLPNNLIINHSMYDPPNKSLQPDIERNHFSKTHNSKFIKTLNVERLEKHVLALQNHLLKKEIELYEWRQKTDFPIVKIDSFKIIEEKLQKTHLQVIINSCYQTITQLRELKIEEVTLLIKQAFIGYERLSNKFKAFEVKPQMIVIDQRNKCRVWVNSNFSLNQIERELKDCESFYKNIINIFQEITLRTPITTNFYINLKNCNCFIKGLKFIQNFIKQYRLKPNPKHHIMKKITSTPNLVLLKSDQQRLYPIEQQSRNLRQTIGYLRKTQQNDYKNLNQAMTFAGKKTRPLQKRLQQIIQQIPNNQIHFKNNILLDKFTQKSHQKTSGDNLKKVFRSIKDFKFWKIKDQQKQVIDRTNSQKEEGKGEEKFLGFDKVRFETTRHEFEGTSRKKYEFVLKNVPNSNKNIQEVGRFSVTQTRSTSFFNISGDRFFPQDNSTHSSKKFGNIKFSEISHKKNSETSDFNKDIENILFGIDGNDKGKETSKKQFFSQQNISNKSLYHNCDRSHQSISILEHEELPVDGFKKLSFTKTLQTLPSSPQKDKSHGNAATAKYGTIDDDIEEPTADQISRKYIELGWKNTLNLGSLNEEVTEMKESIHAGEDQRFGLGSSLGVENRPLLLGKLDRIKNKQLVQSVMNQDFFGQ